MAKDGGKKGKRIPKRIAGMKIPKDVRRSGEALIGALEEPATRQALATGLKAAAGVFAASVVAKAATRGAGPWRADGTGAAPVPPAPPTPPHPPVPPVPPHPSAPDAARPDAPAPGEPWDALMGMAASAAGAALEGWLKGRRGPGPVDPATGEPQGPAGER